MTPDERDYVDRKSRAGSLVVVLVIGALSLAALIGAMWQVG